VRTADLAMVTMAPHENWNTAIHTLSLGVCDCISLQKCAKALHTSAQ